MPTEPPVLDSSAVSRLVLMERDWEAVDSLLQRAEDQDLVPKSLEFAKLETANAIWKQVTRQRKINLDRAMLFLESLSTHPIDYLIADEVLMKEALRLGAKHRLTVYDSAFITLADRSGGTLVTTDETQAKVAEKYVKVVVV